MARRVLMFLILMRALLMRYQKRYVRSILGNFVKHDLDKSEKSSDENLDVHYLHPSFGYIYSAIKCHITAY